MPKPCQPLPRIEYRTLCGVAMVLIEVRCACRSVSGGQQWADVADPEAVGQARDAAFERWADVAAVGCSQNAR